MFGPLGFNLYSLIKLLMIIMESSGASSALVFVGSGSGSALHLKSSSESGSALHFLVK